MSVQPADTAGIEIVTAASAPSVSPPPAATPSVNPAEPTTGVIEILAASHPQPKAHYPQIAVGVLMVLGGSISVQMGAAFAVTVFPVLGSFGATAARFFFTALLMAALIRPKFWRWTGRQWLAIGALAAVLACMNTSFYASIERIPLSIAVCIEFLGPLTAAALMSRRPRDLVWIGVALAGISMFFLDNVIGTTSLDLLGVIFVLIAGMFWGLYIHCSAWVGKVVPGTEGIAGSLIIGALLLMPFGLRVAHEFVIDPTLIVVCLLVSVLSSAIPYTLQFLSLRRVPRSTFGVLLSLEPVVAALTGWLVLSQGLSTLAVCAIVLVVIASTGSTLLAGQRS